MPDASAVSDQTKAGVGKCANEYSKPHPFSRGLKKDIGEPQFRKRVKLRARCPQRAEGWRRLGDKPPYHADNGTSRSAGPVPGIKISIPLADGNPDSRVYAYDVEIAGDNPKEKGKPISVRFNA